jgi:hypothetical protein
VANKLYITFTESLDESELEHLYWMISEYAQVDDGAHLTESGEVVNTTNVNICEADDPDHECYEFAITMLVDGDKLYNFIEEEFGSTLEGMEYITETEVSQ